eukprot:TRINITY_DN1219_c0_g1_i9.p1 TRINITY_DN1219_c0_g1~~TRINITY_DN1219_c0_g1_i9.p1  ORF type:complete len:282 (-),score=69.53 TRINITY_DN1219_c0_g1_i9:355-1200(-)
MTAESQEAAEALIDSMSTHQLQQLITALNACSAGRLEEHVPQHARPAILARATSSSQKQMQQMNTANQVETNKLLCFGVDPVLASQLLEATQSSSGLYSEFRAANLLQVVSGKHRCAQLTEMFGSADHELAVATACLKTAFYPESTLEALELLRECPELGPVGAAEKVVERKELLTRQLFESQGLSSKALREAQATVRELEGVFDASGCEGCEAYQSALGQAREMLEVLEALSAQARAIKYATIDSTKDTHEVRCRAEEILKNVKRTAREYYATLPTSTKI